MPEAYALLRPYKATRPGLLVLDADGRHVASIALAGARPEAVAAALEKARTREPTERFMLDGTSFDALEKRLGVLDGIKSINSTTTPTRGHLEFRITAGALSPKRLEALLEETRTVATLRDPVPVAVPITARGAFEKLGAVPGVWYRSRKTGTNAWICRFLLHPALLRKAGLEADVESRRFSFDDLPKGGLAVRVLNEPYRHAGVLNVISHVFDDAVEVVGRTGQVDFDALEKAFHATLKALAEGPPAGG